MKYFQEILLAVHRVNPSDVTITVHYQDDNGNSVPGLTDTSVSGKSGDDYTIPNPSIDGYTYEKTTVPLIGKLLISQSAIVTYKKNN